MNVWFSSNPIKYPLQTSTLNQELQSYTLNTQAVIHATISSWSQNYWKWFCLNFRQCQSYIQDTSTVRSQWPLFIYFSQPICLLHFLRHAAQSVFYPHNAVYWTTLYFFVHKIFTFYIKSAKICLAPPPEGCLYNRVHLTANRIM